MQHSDGVTDFVNVSNWHALSWVYSGCGECVYTARISKDIAKSLNAQTLAERSPSFRGFLAAVKNGTPPTAPDR